MHSSSFISHPRHRLGPMLLLAGAGFAAVVAAPPAGACGGIPPQPRCGKTLVVTLATPDVILLPAGGNFDVDALVYFRLADWPPGAGVCPPGPYTVDVDVTLECDGDVDPDGGGSVTGIGITPGYTRVRVPVTADGGAPLECDVWADATMDFSDGMTLANSSHSKACLGEPLPGDPDVPRLEMRLLDPRGTKLSRVHPGDQARFGYRITNHDPDHAFSGTLHAVSRNAARLPQSSGASGPGTGAFAISDPGEGDNFPLAFPAGLDPSGCVPLPPDPQLQVDSSIQTTVDLAPGESADIPIFVRPWGMCPDGSCGNVTVVADGQFADTSPGLACQGTVVAADTSVPPTGRWPDSGRVVRLDTVVDRPQAIEHDTLPLDNTPAPIQTEIVALALSSGGEPIAPTGTEANSDPFSGRRGERGRTEIRLHSGDSGFLFPVGSGLNGQTQIGLQSSGGTIQTEIVDVQLIANAPTGFSDTAPLIEIDVNLSPASEVGLGAKEIMILQLSGVAIDELGGERPLSFGNVTPIAATRLKSSASTKGVANALDITFDATVGPGEGDVVQEVALRLDYRGYAQSGERPFLDGFELNPAVRRFGSL